MAANELLRGSGIAEELTDLLGTKVDVVAASLLRGEVSSSALADAVAVSHSEDEHFADILGAVERCRKYASLLRKPRRHRRGCAVTVRRDAGLMPDVPWASIAGLRNVVVHEYFRVNPHLVLDIVDHQLADLAVAVRKR